MGLIAINFDFALNRLISEKLMTLDLGKLAWPESSMSKIQPCLEIKNLLLK